MVCLMNEKAVKQESLEHLNIKCVQLYINEWVNIIENLIFLLG